MENIKKSPPMEALTTVRNYFRTNYITVPDVIEQYFCEPNTMKSITKLPGLKHISEDIFKLLDEESLMDCRLVNNSWKEIVDQPMFNLKKLKLEYRDIPPSVHKSWKGLAQ